MENPTKSTQEIINQIKKEENLPMISESSNHLPELTEKEIADLILAAREKKAAEIRTAEYWAKVREEKPKPTIDQFLDYCFYRFERNHQKRFIVDSQNEYVFNQLLKYFYGSATMENDGIDPNKGILIWGQVGTGKTWLMKFFADNPMNSFRVVQAIDVAMVFQRGGYDGKDGYEGLNIFSQTNYQSMWSGLYPPKPCMGFCFDDMGIEQVPAAHFGNSLNVMAYVIQTRSNNSEFFAPKTHVTTNLSINQIEELYGERVRSRFSEMFNLVKLTGDDRRRVKS